jgi:hypothetical protein
MPYEYSDDDFAGLSRKLISTPIFPFLGHETTTKKKYDAHDTFPGTWAFPLFLFLLFCLLLAHRRTLDNDATPHLNADCPFEGKEPLAIGGECFLEAGVQFLLFWVV